MTLHLDGEIVGIRTVDEGTLFFYDLQASPCCVHGVSLFEPCRECNEPREVGSPEEA